MNARVHPLASRWCAKRTAACAGLFFAAILCEGAAADGEKPAEDAVAPLLRSNLPQTVLRARNPQKSALLWRNGESLEGELGGFDGDRMIWRTDLFDSPIALNPAVLARIDFHTPAYQLPAGSFRVILIDGSHLAGEIVGAGENRVIFESPLAGTIGIEQDQIARMERLRGAGIALPHGQVLLTENTGTDPSLPMHWLLTAGGGLASPSFNEALERAAPLPPRGTLSMRFHTNAQIQFSIGLTVGSLVARLETWDDELVLKSSSHFVSARTFAAEVDRAFDFQLRWDAEANRVELFSEGEKLAELAAAEPVSAEPPEPPATPRAKNRGLPWIRLFNNIAGLFRPNNRAKAANAPVSLRIHNKGAGMYLEHCQIAEGSLPPLPPLPTDTPYAITREGIAEGELVKIADGQAHLERADGTRTTIPLETLHAFRWPRKISMDRDPSLTELWFSDGQLIRGQVLDGQSLTFQTAFSVSPLELEQDGLRALILGTLEGAVEGPALDTLDVLSVGSRSIHGSTEFDGGALPRFFPVGSEQPVALPKSGRWNLTRLSSQTVEPPATEHSGLAHLTTNETIPITLTEADESHFGFRSDLFETASLPVERLHAVQFKIPGERPVSFDGAGWKALGRRSPNLARRAGGIELPPHAAIGHGYAAQGGEVRFTLKRQSGNGSIRVRLFTEGTDPKSGGVSFLIAHYGSSIYFGPESSSQPGYMDGQNSELEIRGKPPVLRFRISDDTVQLLVNNAASAPPVQIGEGRKGTGVIVESVSIWGNPVGTVWLSDFSNNAASFDPGMVPFAEEAKREALLLPRLRRDPAPKHLLIGRNGDLLRGDIDAFTRSALDFRTGLESFRIPSERLTAIVWLKPVAYQTPAVPEAGDSGSPLWIDLVGGGRIALNVEAWQAEHAVGNHPLLGRCQIPLPLVLRISVQEPGRSAAHASLSDWQLRLTRDPVLPGESGTDSPWIGQPAPAFTLQGLDGEKRTLADLEGKVVVLDFWATWCGPCVQSLPGLLQTMAKFPADAVAFLTINQGENGEQIRQFLEARGLHMPVALDFDQSVGRDYGVESIPHTVIVGRDGKVVFVKTGASANGAAQIADAIRAALTPPGS